MDYKQCTNPECLQWFPATEEYFYKQLKHNKNKGSFYVLSSWCRICHKQKSKKYRDGHSEESRKKKREWYKNNTNHVKIYNKEYNEKDPSVKRNILKQWQENNPDKIKDYQFNRMHKNHNITNEEWISCKKYFDDSCAYCGLHISEHFNTYAGEIKHTDFHKEHVDDNGSNDLSNCIPACKSCNCQKHISELATWYNEDNPKYSKERYNKIIKWLNEDYKKFIIKV